MDFSDADEPQAKRENPASYHAPTIKFDRKSTYQANYTKKALNVDRKIQPHKPFTQPVEKMETHTLYNDTYVVKHAERVKQCIPKEEWEPPNDEREMRSEMSASYQTPPLSYELKGRPFKPYTTPTIKMETHTLYNDTYVVKHAERVKQCIPKEEWEPPNDEREMRSETSASYQTPPMSVERKGRPFKPFSPPVIKMETHTLYRDTYVVKHAERVKQCVPKEEWEPPNDEREMRSEMSASYQTPPLSYELKGRPFKPYTTPTVKMATDTTYRAGFTVKNSPRADKFLPKTNSWYKMTEEGHEGTEHHREFKPIALQDMRDARMAPFIPKSRPLGTDEEMAKSTTCHDAYVNHGLLQRPEQIRPVDNDFTYQMRDYPSDCSLDKKQ